MFDPATYKSSKTQLEKDIRKYEEKIKKLKIKKDLWTVGLQTDSTVDIPYDVKEPLPPIVASKLCKKTKPVFLSRSLPDLSLVTWVAVTEEDTILESAEEALSEMYEREITEFYHNAKKDAGEARFIKNLTKKSFTLELG